MEVRPEPAAARRPRTFPPRRPHRPHRPPTQPDSSRATNKQTHNSYPVSNQNTSSRASNQAATQVARQPAFPRPSHDGPDDPRPFPIQSSGPRALPDPVPRVILQVSQPVSPRPFVNHFSSPRVTDGPQSDSQTSTLAIRRPSSNLQAVASQPIANHSNSPRTSATRPAFPRPLSNLNSQEAPSNQVASSGGGWPRRGTGQRQEGQDPPNGVARIHVSGYPVYAQEQDLISCFSKFGNVRIEKMTNKYACLAYCTAAEAQAAIQANNKIIVYGAFLTVREFKAAPPDLPPQKHTPKRDFSRSKQKEVIVEPKDIDLSGDFTAQMDSILARVRLTQEEATAISSLYTDVEEVLQAQWPGCVAVPFGSITTGLGIKTSDADCFVHLPSDGSPASPQHVNRAKRILHSYPQLFAEILSIPRANTPIVKFFHIPTQTNCDLTFKTPLGSQNSRLIGFLLHSDPRLIPISVLIKYWAKVHGLSGTGKLTNYALTMMIIFYLQQPPLSILPSVKWLQRDRRNDVIVDYWNTGFMANRDQFSPTSNTSTVSELLGGFFEFYSMFNFEDMVVCPYLGAPIKKEAFKDLNLLPDAFQRYKDNVLQGLVYPMRHTTSMCVQDPFEQSHNVASAISNKLASEIKAYLKFAANAYEKDKLKKCQEFLKTILLEKPNLPKAKAQDYRVNLFPRLIINIKVEDWQSVVRQVICTIFEMMLKIKLSKIDEKPSPKSKKLKEKYTGAVTKAIWKRKQFTRIYSAMNLDFKQKQSRITEEIMNVEKEVLNIKFQLMVTYAPNPRSAVASVKLTDGDNEAFKDFGRFFISVLQNWFIVLLKPEAKPSAVDTAAKIAETIQILDGTNEPNTSIDSYDVSVASETTNSRENAREKDSSVTNNDASEKDSAMTNNEANEKDSNMTNIHASEKESAITNKDVSEKDNAMTKNDASEKDSSMTNNYASEKESAMTNNDASEEDSAMTNNNVSKKDSAMTNNDASEKDSAIKNNEASEKDSYMINNDASEKYSAMTNNDASDKDSAMTNNDASEKESAMTINDVSEKDSDMTNSDASEKDSNMTNKDASEKYSAMTNNDASDKDSAFTNNYASEKDSAMTNNEANKKDSAMMNNDASEITENSGEEMHKCV